VATMGSGSVESGRAWAMVPTVAQPDRPSAGSDRERDRSLRR
jgi:hypothetical protein